MVHRSGREVWVRDIARISQGDDDARFWRGVLIDISAERSAQAALADAHERHRGMIDSMPACSYRAERRAMGRWHFVSAQIEPLLGYTPEEWCADPTLWRASLHADDRERLELEEQRLMELPAGTEVVSEYRLRHRSAGWSPSATARSSPATPRELLIEGILTDISAERAAEAVADGLTDVYRLSCGDCGVQPGPRSDSAAAPNARARTSTASRSTRPCRTSPPRASRSRVCSTGSRSTSTRSAPTCARSASPRRISSSGASRYGSRVGFKDRLSRAFGTSEGSLHPDGLGRALDRRRRLRRLGHRRRLRRAGDGARLSPGAHRPGMEAVLTSDWPLDEYGRGDISLRVPAGRGIEAEEMLEPE